MLTEFQATARDLQDHGKPFVVATVVRAERPTSAKVGSKAIFTAEGILTGWVGGSCAEPTVRREARQSLRDGQPRLLRLCPPEQLGRAPQDGVVEVALTCVSGGTLEIYLEPQFTQPHLVIVGHQATAQALVTIGQTLGYPVTVISPEASRDRFPDADRVLD
ncbi:MAG: XdhC family protein, partial [Anaerolineales bacterium]